MLSPTARTLAFRLVVGLLTTLLVVIGGSACSGSSVERRDTFAPVAGLPPVQAVAVGGDAPVALARDGTVYAWGSTFYGQPGAGRDENCGNTMNPRPCRRTPTVVQLPGPATAIAASDDHDLATTGDGTVWTWGADHTPGAVAGSDRACGALRCRSVPVAVGGLPPVTAISAGPGVDVALDATGRVWAWGATIEGADRCSRAVARGPGYACSVRPRPVRGLPPVTTVSAAAQGRVTALDTDGVLWWWGTGYPGPYPTGTPSYAAPRRVELPVRVTGLVAAGSTTVAVGADGSVWAWGVLNAGDRARCIAGDGCLTTPLLTVPPGSAAGLVPGGSLRVRTTTGQDLSYATVPLSGYGPLPVGGTPVHTDPAVERGWFGRAPAPGTVAVAGDDGAAGRGSVTLRLSDSGQVEASGDNSDGQLAE